MNPEFVQLIGNSSSKKRKRTREPMVLFFKLGNENYGNTEKIVINSKQSTFEIEAVCLWFFFFFEQLMFGQVFKRSF